MRYLLMLSFLSLWACSSQQETKVLKLAHGLDINHPVHKSMVYMANQLDSISSGALNIQIYSGGQLGNERELLELLQIGSLAITKVSTATLENFVPAFSLLGLPYLFKNREQSFEVLDGPIGQQLLLEGIPFRFIGLCFYDAGSRSFYTKERPVDQPKDLDGLKIRVMKSPMAVAMVDQLGGSPTPISFGELYTALQQGVVDGAENNPSSFYTSRHYEVCKFYSLDEHTRVPDILLISEEWWDNLDTQEQKWLKTAVKASVVFQRKAWDEAEQLALQAIKDAGVEISYPDKKPFSKAVQAVYQTIEQDPKMAAIIHEIKNTGL